MGRIITEEKKNQIAAARLNNPDAVGPILGELVIEGNIPIEAVAELLNVSEPTIYRWMYGHVEPRDGDKIVKIKKLLTILRKAKRAKDTPLQGNIKTRIVATGKLVEMHRPVPRSE